MCARVATLVRFLEHHSTQLPTAAIAMRHVTSEKVTATRTTSALVIQSALMAHVHGAAADTVARQNVKVRCPDTNAVLTNVHVDLPKENASWIRSVKSV